MKYKYFHFPIDIYIFIIIPLKIIRFRRQVNRLGYNKLLSGFEGNNFTRSPDDKFLAKLNKFHKASSFFLVKIFKDPNPCMIRSLILYEMCGKNNIEAALVTGVHKNMDVLKGHSWLKIKGKPFNENSAFIKDFTVISEV